MALSPQLSRIHELAGKLLLLPPEHNSHHLLQVREDLKTLQRMAPRIEAVLCDAEKRAIQEKLVKLWLRELKGVAYDAEDVLDEYDYELLRDKVEAGSQTDEAADPLPCKRKYGRDEVSESALRLKTIQKVRGRFEEIYKDLKDLSLMEGNSQWGHSQVRQDSRLSSHIVDVPNICGRRVDLEKVIESLMHPDECKNSNLSVLPIVGMGGVGKTTLVQHVYNDPRICDHFQMKGWVCVSDDFNVVKLTKSILESFTDDECRLKELSVLHNRLKERLEGKRFLLVLDDVWNENRNHWENLQKPLTYGAQGSAVITTTRSKTVAMIMQTMPLHHLDCLSADDCWAVFRERAFVDRDPDDHPDLVEVGLKIVKKCGGLPLAAKSLGGLLSYETEVAAWEDILQSDIWDIGGDQSTDEIIPALRLSYLHLSVHLRQCFLYASVFPKDFVFEKDEMVRLWMAQGFIQCESSTKRAEICGNEYFEQLLQRSFFQNYPSLEYGVFVMHDLIHDLAQQISGGEFFHMDTDTTPHQYPDNVHHVSITEQTEEEFEKVLIMNKQWSSIRTLIFRYPLINWRFQSLMMTPALKFLRVLDLCVQDIAELPDSVGDLKHLRYLNLDGTDIKRLPDSICNLHKLQTLSLNQCEELERLPDSICKLYELQTLSLNECRNLKRLPDSICKLHKLQTLSLNQCEELERLPKDIKDLCNLEHLKIMGTYLNFIPIGFGKLTRLCTLDEFQVIQKRKSCSITNEGCSKTAAEEELNKSSVQLSDEESGGIEVLKDLNLLRGKLEISDLQYVMNAEDARLADLRSKINIRQLVLRYCGGDEDEDEDEYEYEYEHWYDHCCPFDVVVSPHVQTQVLANLQPPDRLESLSIYYYYGLSFPSWMAPSSLSKLVRLEIQDCNQCTALPPLGQLPCLKHISIKGMHMVETVGSEFYGHANMAFPKLEELKFRVMGNWVTWETAAADRVSFPRLRRLTLYSCIKLKSMVPLYLLPALEELQILNCGFSFPSWMAEDPSSLSKLVRLEIKYCKKCTALPPLGQLPCLKHLVISNMDMVETVGSEFSGHANYMAFPKLEELAFEYMRNWVTWETAADRVAFPLLRRLTLCSCIKLKWMVPLYLLPALEELQIDNCEELLQPPDCLESLSIFHYNGLSFPSWMAEDPSSLSKLVRLEIQDCERCTALPPLGQLPCLKHLVISNMDMVETVGSEFYGHANYMAFSKLEELKFRDMKNWVTWETAAADRVAFPLLRRLTLFYCYKLKSMVPLYLLPALEELHIWKCEELISIELGGSWNGLSSSSNNITGPPPSLKKMEIEYCPRAHFSPEDDEHIFLPPTLEYLNIWRSPFLVAWCDQDFRLSHVPHAQIWTNLDNDEKIVSTFEHWSILGNRWVPQNGDEGER